ncbi:hypothetical protein DSECCO2_662940 [anaerobic digester metagenome]|jgi:hypothetical protein
MKIFFPNVLFILFIINPLFSQKQKIISDEDLHFLESMTRDVMESARIYPLQKLPDPFGINNTGGTLIRPGGRDTYPAFWIRDYAMSLETGFVSLEEQRHMVLLTATTQCDQTWITKEGTGMIPVGAIADHILVENSLPIYYPGTYDYELQGSKEYQYGYFPPYCDQFYFIHMVHYYVQHGGDPQILCLEINGEKLIERLDLSFRVPPSDPANHLVYTTEHFLGVDFGFRDAIQITGHLCFPSILKYRAAVQLSELYIHMKDTSRAKYYSSIASAIKQSISEVFTDRNGMLMASTGQGNQPDVWSTALAIFHNILEKSAQKKACAHLLQAYRNQKLAYRGNIRHIIHGEDFSKDSAWEIAKVQVNTYQNGAYWGTPTGWVAYAISLIDPPSAAKLTKEYIDDLRENDFRKGEGFEGPFECIFPPSYARGPLYLTTVSCPYIVFKE